MNNIELISKIQGSASRKAEISIFHTVRSWNLTNWSLLLINYFPLFQIRTSQDCHMSVSTAACITTVPEILSVVFHRRYTACDCRLPPRSNCCLASSGLLRSVFLLLLLLLLINVSGRFVGPIIAVSMIQVWMSVSCTWHNSQHNKSWCQSRAPDTTANIIRADVSLVHLTQELT